MKIISTSFEEVGVSVIGAGILGFGLGILLSNFYSRFAWPIILIGIVMHSIGMYLVHKNKHNKNLAISDALYWICWIILLGIVLVFIWRYFL